jgi:hypothetical protein
MSFDKDLARGIDVEQIVLSMIRKRYPCAVLVNAYHGYDIWVPEINKSIEVKYDEMSNQTGNIVVEIEMSGKLSALMTTTADFWIFYDGEIFVRITPKKIIECIFLNKLRFVEFTGKGDLHKKKAFLIPKNILFSYGKNMDETL